jgi:predicted RNase H-like nuclease (RuvC/YqgF family)
MLFVLLGCLTPRVEKLEAQVTSLEADKDALQAQVDALQAEVRAMQEEKEPVRTMPVVVLTPEGLEEAAARAVKVSVVVSPDVWEQLKNQDIPTLLRAIPHKGQDGTVDGLRLSAIRRESIFEKLGFKNGDVVHAWKKAAWQKLSSVEEFKGWEGAEAVLLSRRMELTILEFEE